MHEVQQTAELKQYAMMVGDGMGFLSVVADGVEAGGTDAGDEDFAVVAVEVGKGRLHRLALLQGHESGEPIGFVDVEAVRLAALAAVGGDSDEVDVGGVGAEGEEFDEHVGFQWGGKEKAPCTERRGTGGRRQGRLDELVRDVGGSVRAWEAGVSVGDGGKVVEVVHTDVLLHVGVRGDEGDGFEEDLGLEVVEEVVVGEVISVGEIDIPTGEAVDDVGEGCGGGVDADHLEHLPIGGRGCVKVDGHGRFPSFDTVEGLVLGDPTFTVGG